MNCATFRSLKDIRQPAVGHHCWINVSIERGILPQIVADAFLRIEDKHWQTDAVSNRLHNRREVRISRYDDERICLVFISVHQDSNGYINIRQFLGNPKDADSPVRQTIVTREARLGNRLRFLLLFAIPTFDNLYSRSIAQCIKVLVLTRRLVVVRRLVDHTRCKVDDTDNFMFGIQETP